MSLVSLYFSSSNELYKDIESDPSDTQTGRFKLWNSLNLGCKLWDQSNQFKWMNRSLQHVLANQLRIVYYEYTSCIHTDSSILSKWHAQWCIWIQCPNSFSFPFTYFNQDWNKRMNEERNRDQLKINRTRLNQTHVKLLSQWITWLIKIHLSMSVVKPI